MAGILDRQREVTGNIWGGEMMSENNPTSVEITEQYTEMRRYRDYQLTIATWFTSILVAIIGGILTLKFGDKASDFVKFLEIDYIKELIIAVIISISFCGCYTTWYTNKRYEQLKEMLSVRDTWKCLKPHHLIIFTFFIIGLSGGIVVWTR